MDDCNQSVDNLWESVFSVLLRVQMFKIKYSRRRNEAAARFSVDSATEGYVAARQRSNMNHMRRAAAIVLSGGSTSVRGHSGESRNPVSFSGASFSAMTIAKFCLNVQIEPVPFSR